MQILLNAAAYFGITFLFSAGFYLQYRMFRFFDLSLGAVFLVGAYLFTVVAEAGRTEFFGILLSAAIAGVIGVILIEFLVRPLARLGASPLDLTLCALGVYIIGLNFIALIFGDEIRRPTGLEMSRSIDFGTAVLSGSQFTMTSLALVSFIIIVLVLALTPSGRAFRALSDSPNLARDLGLAVRPAIIMATATGAALVGTAGALIAADLGIRPTTAFPYIIPGLAAVLAFGGRTLPQTLLGAAVVALTGELAGLLFGQQWRELSIFAVVSVFLMARTRIAPALRS